MVRRALNAPDRRSAVVFALDTDHAMGVLTIRTDWAAMKTPTLRADIRYTTSERGVSVKQSLDDAPHPRASPVGLNAEILAGARAYSPF